MNDWKKRESEEDEDEGDEDEEDSINCWPTQVFGYRASRSDHIRPAIRVTIRGSIVV